MSPRVLFVSNVSATKCGVAEFGRVMAEELRRSGVDLTVWDGHYPAIYEKPYLPADAAGYDWIHLNWHPVTLNHYRPEHLPDGPRVSLYVHDLPPWSTCALWPRATVRWAAEPYPGTELLRYPALTDVTAPLVDWSEPRTIGWTGIRGDGRAIVERWAEARGWTVNLPTGWLGTRDEIRRLRRSTINVLWYSESVRGKSLALMTAAAARRPLLINGSLMFDAAWPYRDEIYRAGFDPAPPWLDTALMQVIDDLAKRRERIPDRFLYDHSWELAARQVRATWEARR